MMIGLRKQIRSLLELRKILSEEAFSFTPNNRAMHISGTFGINRKNDIQSANLENSKCQNGTLELSFEELEILIKEPTATQKTIAKLSGKSERTIKRRTVEIQKKGLICRENGKRNGRWKVLVEV